MPLFLVAMPLATSSYVLLLVGGCALTINSSHPHRAAPRKGEVVLLVAGRAESERGPAVDAMEAPPRARTGLPRATGGDERR